jgi:hypothetical protein
MKELMLLLSSAIPEEFVLDSLAEEIQGYKVTKDPAKLEKIQMFCTMVLSKAAVEKAGGADGDGIGKIMKEMDDMERGRDILNPKPN